MFRLSAKASQDLADHVTLEALRTFFFCIESPLIFIDPERFIEEEVGWAHRSFWDREIKFVLWVNWSRDKNGRISWGRKMGLEWE